MLTDAGFVEIDVHDAPDDPFDSVYVARKSPVHVVQLDAVHAPDMRDC
jgi:hypothetical protein